MSLMDFDQSGVRLLQFTPLFTDTYTPHNYPQCMDTAPSSVHMNTSMNEDMIMAVSSPTPMHQPPPYCDESRGYAANEPNPSTIYSTAIDQQSYNQALSPAVSLAPSYHDGLDLESIDFERILSGDLGPHPVRIPRLEEEPPRNKESAFTGPQNSWLASPGRSHSNPHSPQDMRQRTLLVPNKARASQQSSKSPRNLIKRATSPVFPDQSTPLSSVSLSRHPSLTSLSCSSTMSDPFTTVSVAAQSDPGPRAATNRELYDYRAECNTAVDSAIHSPSMSLQESPSYLFSGSEASSPQLLIKSSRTCMELEMPQKYVRKIVDLDRRILKLQAERAKVLEKAHQTNPAGTGPKAVVGRANVDGWLLNDVKETEMCSVPLYIFPLGIQEFDDPMYEAANSILRHVGGLYYDLKSSIGSLRNICCKGVLIRTEISTCFAYIKSLLRNNQKLKLSNSEATDTKSYRIQVDNETGTLDGNEVLGSIDESQSHEFITALTAANYVLRCAQKVSNSYSSVQTELQQVREMATKTASDFEITCNKQGIVDRERRNQLKSVLEGNCTTLASAQRVWPQYYQVATETIRTITECIHPSSYIV